MRIPKYWRARIRPLRVALRSIPYAFARLLGACTKIARPLPSKDPEAGHLVVADLAPGSCGDMAMIKATAAWLMSRGQGRVTVLADGSHEDWHLDSRCGLLTFSMESHANVYGMLFRFARILVKHKRCYLIGADLMDGAYGDAAVNRRILFANLAAAAGRKTTIIGCSINESPSESAASDWKRLDQRVKACARDPQSSMRLRLMADRTVTSVADVAFLLAPETGSEATRIEQWAAGEKLGGRHVLALNLGKQALRSLARNGPLKPRDVDSLLESLATNFTQISQETGALSLVLLPHDTRGPRCDQELLEQFAELLPEQLRAHTTLSRTRNPAEIKQLLAYCDGLVTARMHAAVAGLGVGTPTLSLPYQGKFEGLYELVGIDDLVATSYSDAAFKAALVDLIRRNENHRATIRAALPRIKRLSELNF